MKDKNQQPHNPLRKPYRKPAVSHRELMESVAGGCESPHPINGKVGSGGDTCTVIGS